MAADSSTNLDFTLSDIGAMVRHRRKMAAWVAFVIMLAATVVIYTLEDKYASYALISIETPEVADPFLPGTYRAEDREHRIAQIEDEALQRNNLIAIIEKHDLYADRRNGRSAASAVKWMREDIQIEVVTSDTDPRDRRPGQVTGFRISYFDTEPKRARAVAMDLSQLFLDANMRRRMGAYTETSEALDSEAEKIRVEIEALEGVVQLFKENNPGALPEDRKLNQQKLDRKNLDLDDVEREIRALQERKTLLQTQLAQTVPYIANPDTAAAASAARLSELEAEYLQALANYSPNHPDVARLRREINTLTGGAGSPGLRQAMQIELDARRAELRALESQYPEDYPDVGRQRRAIAALETQLASMSSGVSAGQAPTNPVYINLQIQLQAVNTELAALQQNRRELQAQIFDLEDKVTIAPDIERQYLELTRDYDSLQAQYKDILGKRHDATLGGSLEQLQLSERYVLQRPPRRPYLPAFPNRPLLLVISGFLALSVGLGAGLIAEALNSAVRGTRDVRAVFEAPPMAAIPFIPNEKDHARARMRTFATAGSAVLMVALVAGYVHMQRTGMI